MFRLSTISAGATESHPGNQRVPAKVVGGFARPPSHGEETNMVSKIWDGANARFNDPRHWSPPGVPRPGDTATISSTTVLASNGSLLGIAIDLGSPDQMREPTLDVRNEALGNISVHGEPSDNG